MARQLPTPPTQHDPGRRRLLKYGGLAAALPVASALHAGPTGAPHTAAAQDISQGYSGPGYYLYPAWGEPALYQVSSESPSPNAEPLLAFRNPHSGKMLWTQSLQGEARFAGKLGD